jgi:hypothetical protein
MVFILRIPNQLARFTVVICWSTVVLKPRVKTGIEGIILQYSTEACPNKIEVITATDLNSSTQIDRKL